LGKIGFQVATIALAFGMKVLAHRKSNRPASNPKIKMVDFETLLQESDVLSLHAPLTSENKEIINKESLSKMKKTAFLINTGRGGLLNEPDLKEALLTHTIAGAGLDVLTTEPPEVHHPLLGIQNCIITPHHAWAALESRERLVNIVAKNIKGYQEETPQNVVY
jgi:glycerate dehydrogenase